jgi:hypothetical protein
MSLAELEAGRDGGAVIDYEYNVRDSSNRPTQAQKRKRGAFMKSPLHAASAQEHRSRTSGWQYDCAVLGLLFVCSLVGLIFLLSMTVFHGMEYADMAVLHAHPIPTTLTDAKAIGEVLARFKAGHFWQLVLGVSLCYIWLQAWSIPGTLFTNLIAGFLFGNMSFPLCVRFKRLCS